MLKWFADRLAHQGSEVRKDERGFTLIELLVVVIIIGILAAIAIPTFLSQRDNADDATAESDVRNMAASAAAFAADNEGKYERDTAAGGTENMSATILADDYDWNKSDSTSNAAVAVGGNAESFVAQIDSDAGNTFYIASDDGTVEEATDDNPVPAP